MSLYNVVNGMNLATFLILPALGQHADTFPRFRDCFVRKGMIVVLTRTGGYNREEYPEENEAITKMEGYVTTYDDDFDSTFAYWEFTMPTQWKGDIEHLLKGEVRPVSEAYKKIILQTYPRVAEKLAEGLTVEGYFPEDAVKDMVYADERTPFDNWPGRK